MKREKKLGRVKKINWLMVVLVLMALTPVFWFVNKGGALINGLDTNFPLDPIVWFARRFYVWNSVTNMGVDFSSSVAGLFFHLIQAIPFYFGASLQLTEILSLVFWYGMVVFGAYYGVSSFGKVSRMAKLLFVAVYAYNIYLFNTWENVKVSNLALVVALPLFLGLLQRYKRKEVEIGGLAVRSIVFGVLAAGSGINPAYFSVIVLSIVIYLFVSITFNWGEMKRVSRGVFVSLVVLVGVNMFWILPLISFMFLSGGVSGLEELGFTNWLASLSEHTSLVNVLRLQGAWDWYALDEAGFPLYIPYALNYFYSLPFIAFSYVLPVLAMSSLVFWDKSKGVLYRFFAVILVLGIFMGTGLNGPTGVLYRLLVSHVPFFSFYRSPWYIFTPLTVLAYAGLLALLYERLKVWMGKELVTGFAVIFLVGYAFYSYPLITGKIFRLGRADSFVVSFPKYIWEAKGWIENGKQTSARVVTYPDDDLESFEWGYRGTESILGLISDQEFITPSFNVSNKSFRYLLDKFYRLLKMGSYDSALAILPYFGADTLLIKDDASSLSPKIDTDIESWGKLTTIGSWRFLEKEGKTQKFYIPGSVYKNLGEIQDFADVASYLTFPTAVVSLGDSEVAKAKVYDGARDFGRFKHINYENNPSGRDQLYEYDFAKGGEYYFVVERNGVVGSEIEVWFNDELVRRNLIEEKDAVIVIGPLAVDDGMNRVKLVFPEAQNLVDTSGFNEVVGLSKLRGEDLPEEPSQILVAFNDWEKEKRIALPVSNFDPFVNYQLTFDYKYIYGSVPIIDVLQSVPSTPLKVFPLSVGSNMDWERKVIRVEPAGIISNLEVAFRMPGKNMGGRSKSYFENLEFRRVFNNDVFFVEKPGDGRSDVPEIVVEKISPVKYRVSVGGATDDFVMVFSETYSSEWKMAKIDDGAPLVHFSVNGFANGWMVPVEDEDFILEVYYERQNFYLTGGVMSLGTMVVVGVWLVRKRK